MSNLLSTLLHFFSHRFHICSFLVAALQYWHGPATGSVGFFIDTCYQTHPLLCLTNFLYSLSFALLRVVFERQILFNLTKALLAFESLFFGCFILAPSSLQTVAPK